MITLEEAKKRLKAYYEKWPFQEGEGILLSDVENIDNVDDLVLFIEETSINLRNAPPGISVLAAITIE